MKQGSIFVEPCLLVLSFLIPSPSFWLLVKFLNDLHYYLGGNLLIIQLGWLTLFVWRKTNNSRVNSEEFSNIWNENNNTTSSFKLLKVLAFCLFVCFFFHFQKEKKNNKIHVVVDSLSLSLIFLFIMIRFEKQIEFHNIKMAILKLK